MAARAARPGGSRRNPVAAAPTREARGAARRVSPTRTRASRVRIWGSNDYGLETLLSTLDPVWFWGSYAVQPPWSKPTSQD